MASRAARVTAIVLTKLRDWGWLVFIACVLAALWLLFGLGNSPVR